MTVDGRENKLSCQKKRKMGEEERKERKGRDEKDKKQEHREAGKREKGDRRERKFSVTMVETNDKRGKIADV